MRALRPLVRGLTSLLLGFALITGSARAQQPTLATPPPEPYLAALRAANVPTTAVGVVVQPVGSGGGVSFSLNESTPMNPASAMKLVTTYAALQLLGPAYTWRTEAFAVGRLQRDVLEGELALRGSGDPKLVIEHLWLLVHRIRAYGIREIRGDVLLDRSAFELVAQDPGAFDGESLRPYNAQPDALLLNYKAITFGFVPDPETRSARVVVTPPLAGLKAPTLVRGVDGACGDWRSRLEGDFSNAMAPVFRGSYPLSCGERQWHVSVLNHSQFFAAAFRAMWEGAGGKWTGAVREARVPPESRRIALHESATLAEVIRDVNKFSNNVMARQLFLTMGAEPTRQAASTERATRAVRTWLSSRGMEMPELVFENGSGLSRQERISPANLARLLTHAWNSALMPEFVSSLPLVGVDGTMRNRTGAVGNAHIKSGLLNDVRAVAGYVHAQSGRRYVVVALINHANAGAAQNAHDALVEWIYRNG
ncbi:MAG: D-alanyl-D-alanine carboxypeptidase/D-alanyl-D-alanine-endopeptidase [Burkholderiales bacterium]|jgi:D-alanyl-D-alanine carboxypeptidase/D-alanyl-D-alanine-endopeptidase (penicillin-binding protein 4)|nr:D-alanyl-D-alanine carboxypeptidase/D-alanyl-D-alanine-endopeptidase [Burkholderiales bacterium]